LYLSKVNNSRMKKNLWILLCLAFTTGLSAQNLVINGGIDGYVTCPGFGQFSNSYIISWDKPSIASSDYYNYNCPGIQPAVQAPHSGEGYAGIICYNFGTEYREYITGTFLSPLVAGTTYNVEFWVNLHNGYIQAIEEVGAYISTTAPGPFGNVLHINVVPQIENASGALNDTANWKRVFGQYLASGGEQFITIGNFHDDAGTTITQPGTSGSYGAYYFIDDVSVIADSTTSLQNNAEMQQPDITLVHGGLLQITIPSTSHWNKQANVYCYNTSGSLIVERKLTTAFSNVDLRQQSKGIYMIIVENGRGERVFKKIFLSDGKD
jgi:hypothetical protein